MSVLTLFENTLTREQWEVDGENAALTSLPLALSPIVKQDEYTLSFSYPLASFGGKEIKNDRLICADGQLYRVHRVRTEETNGIYFLRVDARHILYDLEDKDIVNIETSETTPGGIPQIEALRLVLQDTPFYVGIVDTDVVLDYLDILQKDALWALKEQVLKLWGGELEVDNWRISIRKQRGKDNGVHIRQHKNVKGIAYEESLDGVITRLHVLGYKGMTFESINEGRDYIDSAFIGSFAHPKEGYVTFSDDDLPADLISKGREYLKTVEKPKVEITVDMPDANAQGFYSELSCVELGDTVMLHHEILGGEISIRVTSREYDPVTGQNVRLIISNDSENLYTLLARASQNNDIIKAITTRKGHVRTESLRGVIDLLTTQIMASGAYTNAGVIPNKGALFENTDAQSQDFGALYIGPGIFAIANTKKPDGSWDWRTFGSGKGFVGDEIIAGSITGDKLKAGSITGDKIQAGSIKAPQIDTHSITADHLAPGIVEIISEKVSGQQAVLELSTGAVLDKDNTETIVTLKLYQDGEDITNRIPETSIHWERVSDDQAGDLAFNLDPEHHGRQIRIRAADIDFRGVLKCIIDETELYSRPIYSDGHLIMRDFGSEDALLFSRVSGRMLYDGENDYEVENGHLVGGMTIGFFQLQETLQNLKTSYLSISRDGIDMYGGGHLTLTSGDKLNIRGGQNGNSIGISNDHPQKYMQWAGAQEPDAAPFSVKMDGTVKATKLRLGMTNMTEISHGWTDGFRDDADSTYPIMVSEYLNSDVLGVKKMLLTFKAEPVRTTAKGAASGGGATSSAGGGGERTSRSGGGGTSGVSGISQTEGPSVRFTTVANTDPHQHEHLHVHGMSHTHTIPNHSHVIKLPDHTHTTPDHTHPLEYGIYEGTTATQMRVYVDGSLAGTFDTNGTQELNIVPYLMRENGHVKRGAYHTVEITADRLTRIVGNIYTQVLLGVDENEPIY